jgi:ATP-dependent RNA helicase DDX5/DBP2
LLLVLCRPNNAEDYVHRIGRTGRAGATGTSYSFFTAANGRLARDIIKIMREANQVVPPALDQLAATSSGGGASE